MRCSGRYAVSREIAASTTLLSYRRRDTARRYVCSANPETLQWVVGTVTFCACYLYSPRGCGTIAKGSRLLRTRLKAADSVWISRYAVRVHEQACDQGIFAAIFDGSAALVPVPRSTTGVERALWPAASLAMALHRLTLAQTVWPVLYRTVAVRKSATAPDGGRPTVQDHFKSFAVQQPARGSPENIVLVDDVITKGRTLLAAAMRLREAFPRAHIRAFALIRTMGLIDDIEQLISPCQGEISWTGDDAQRDP